MNVLETGDLSESLVHVCSTGSVLAEEVGARYAADEDDGKTIASELRDASSALDCISVISAYYERLKLLGFRS